MKRYRPLLPFLLFAYLLLTAFNPPVQAADVRRLARQIDQLQKDGKLEEALPLVKQLAEELSSKKAGESQTYARVLVAQGALQMALEDFRAAQGSLRGAVGILERITRPKDRKGQIMLAQALSALGVALVQYGDLMEAESVLNSALKIQTALLGPKHEDTGETLLGLAMVSLQLGQRTDVKERLARALEILSGKWGENHPQRAFIHAMTGFLLIDDDKLSEAEIELKLALSVLDKYPAYRLLIPKILYGLSMIVRMRGDLDESERLSKKAMDLVEKYLSVDSPSRADILSEAADAAEAAAELPKALRLRHEALEVTRASFGRDDLRSIRYEKELVGLLLIHGEYLEAGTLLDHIELIETAKLATGNLYTADTLYMRGRLQEIRGNLDKAEELEKKSLESMRMQYSGDHRLVAASMEHVGVLLLQRGDPARAAALLNDAFQMRSRILDRRDPGMAFGRISLAMFYRNTGNLVQSNTLLQQVLANLPPNSRMAKSIEALANTFLALNALSEENPVGAKRYLDKVGNFTSDVFGNNGVVVGEVERTLGALLVEQGDTARAESHLRDALDVYLRFSPNSTETARTAMALGIVVLMRGDPIAAEGLFRGALVRIDKGADAGILTPALSFGLAMTLMAEGKPDEAEGEMQRAVAATAQTSEKNYGLLANFLYQLGNFRSNAGDPIQARVFWERAVETAGRKVDPNHPVVAFVKEARARLLARGSIADKVQAAALAGEAVTMISDRFGEDHPLTADALGAQAEVEWAVGHIDAARSALQRRAHAESTNFIRQLVLNNETGYQNLLGSQSPTDLYVSFHWNAAPTDLAAAKLAFEATLQRKGTLQDILAEHARLQHQVGEGAQLFSHWKQAEDAMRACGTARSPLGLASASGLGTECTRDTLSLAADAGIAYKKLIKEVPGFNPKPVELAELAARLHALGDYTLVEIVQYASARPGTGAAPMRYAAYILSPDGGIGWADLGPQTQVDAVVKRLRTLQSHPDTSLVEARDTARELDHLVMEPVRRELKGKTRLFVAADGDLNLINFSSLVDENDHELIAKYNIAGLTSGRDLLRLNRLPQPRPTKDYLFANPAFGASINDLGGNPNSVEFATLGSDNKREAILTCDYDFLHSDWPGVFFDYKAWEKAMYSPVKPYLEAEANRNQLLAIARPRSVWLITHGFFCEDFEGKDETPSAGSTVWRNPMSRSAIVLAGAAAADPATRRNGYVTAEQIAQLNWAGTEMVVLGACETALGTPRIGDGVYGLRRALVLAGVRSQVITLWSVQPKTTFELLQDFASRLASGEERLTALREAQRKVLEQQEYKHPFYWAGIYFMGDPGKMSTY